MLTTHIRGLITPRITTHEPPSRLQGLVLRAQRHGSKLRARACSLGAVQAAFRAQAAWLQKIQVPNYHILSRTVAYTNT